MKKFTLGLLSITALLSSIFFVQTAYGYVTYAYGYYQQNIDADGTTYVESTWRTSVSTAASSWGSAGSKRTASLSTSSINKISTEAMTIPEYGLYTSIEQNTPSIQISNKTTKFKIQINTTKVKDTLTARSTACHEFGHAMGLNENYNFGGPGTSIMDGNRTRLITYSPQPDDISGVNR